MYCSFVVLFASRSSHKSEKTKQISSSFTLRLCLFYLADTFVQRDVQVRQIAPCKHTAVKETTRHKCSQTELQMNEQVRV